MLLQQLQSEFGAAVATRAATPDDAVDGLLPQAVAVPGDEEATVALMAWCGRQNIAVLARGGGTQSHIGAPPRRFDLLISTEKLDAIIDHDEGNATVQAQSGISLAELDRRVRQSGQFVPFDLSREASTLGGAVATNAAGGSRLKYGSPRDLTLGVRVALSDGREIIGGGKVVKNVSGFDLAKVFTGSRGSLGVLTRATIRLRPLSQSIKTWRDEFAELGAAATSARAIFEGAFEPTLLRVSHRGAMWRVEAQFEGGEKAVQTQLDQLSGGQIVQETEVFAGGAIELRAQLPIQSALDWVSAAHAAGADEVSWEVGLGALRAAWAQSTLGEIEKLRAMVQQSGGWMIVERAPLEWKTAEFVWGQKRGDWPFMQRLKAAYDPADVCAPGRLIGGL